MADDILQATRDVNVDGPSARGVADAIQIGALYPTYTWRKGGTADPTDNHLYLTITTAEEVIGDKDTVLIDVNPENKKITFGGEIELTQGVTIHVSNDSIDDGAITSEKLERGIAIDGSVAKLTTARSINGILFDGTKNVTEYTEVTSSASSAVKNVQLPDFAGTSTTGPTKGSRVILKFTNTNTASNPQLNINGTGAKPIRYNGAAIEPGKLAANKCYTFVYDGTYYNLIGDLYEPYVDENVKLTKVADNVDYKLALANASNNQISGLQFAENISYNPQTAILSVNGIKRTNPSSWQSIKNGTGSIVNGQTDGTGFISLASGNNTGNNTTYGIIVNRNGLHATFLADIDNEPSKTVTLINSEGSIVANKFEGVATKALADGNNNVIADTYSTKEELQTAVNTINSNSENYFEKTGGVLSGPLYLNSDEVPDNDDNRAERAAPVAYVDNTVDTAINELRSELTGGDGEGGNTLAALSSRLNEVKETADTALETTKHVVLYDQAQPEITDAYKDQAAENIGVLRRTGGTITGSLLVNEDVATKGAFILINPDLETVNENNQVVRKLPENNIINSIVTGSPHGNITGGMHVTNMVDGTTMTTLTAIPNADEPSDHEGLWGAAITVAADPHGNVVALAPVPPEDSNANNIATTAWTRNIIQQAINEYGELVTKTYENVIGDDDHNMANNVQYFGHIIPETPSEGWQASYLVYVGGTTSAYSSVAHIALVGVGEEISYRITVSHADKNVIPFDGININVSDVSHITSGEGHYIGLSLYRSTNSSLEGYGRNITVVVLDAQHCSSTLFDHIEKNLGNEYNRNVFVDMPKSGFYSTSVGRVGDVLTAYGRLPIVGPGGIKHGNLVAEDANGNLINIWDNTFTTTQIIPWSILYYDGDNLDASSVGQTPGMLYNVHEFDISDLPGDTFSTLSENSKLWLKGSLNYETWLFTVEGVTTEINVTDDEGKCFVLIGYTGSDTFAYLYDNHPIYHVKNNNLVPVGPKPVVTTPNASSNDNTIATTAFVKDLMSDVSGGMLVNPEITSDRENSTSLYISAPTGSIQRGVSVVDGGVSHEIIFRDGTEFNESNVGDSTISRIESVVDPEDKTTSLSLIVVDPSAPRGAHDAEGNVNGIDIIYENKGSLASPNYTSRVELIQQPSVDDDSNSIATTHYVRENIESAMSRLNHIDCGLISEG